MALVYRGPASTPGCPEAVAGLLESCPGEFDVHYVGPGERLRLGERTLAEAALYAQPGGGTLSSGYRHLRPHRRQIREFVRSGGRYLGFCLGGYLAGATPGFDLLPGDADQYIVSAGATVRSEDDTVVDIDWRGERRSVFFQDGPYFWLRPDSAATVLARYPNRTLAALTVGFGAGRVGVVGPHPEATQDWFSDLGLAVPDRLGLDLARDLVSSVMSS